MITGYIEGYYGVELSWKERDSIISKLHQVGCNTYFYCPKEDPYHRVRSVSYTHLRAHETQ